jgi:SAM-dependent methyltransferase
MVVIIIISCIILASFAYAGLSMIIWVPTKTNDLDRILKLAQLRPGEFFYDLGCGNGKVVMFLGKHTEATTIGLELAWPLFLLCKIRQLITHQANINFKLQNIFTADLSQADVIYIFGIPDKLKNKLKPKFETELKPGCRIISYAFKIDGWQPKEISRPRTIDVPIYLYEL